MKNMLKRSISFLLAFAMVCAMLPAIGVYAASLEGSFDLVVSNAPGQITVSGWALNRDNLAGSIELHFYIGGSSGAYGAEGHSGVFTSKYRWDVNYNLNVTGNHGFEATLTSYTGKYGTQDVYAYAINPDGGDNLYLGKQTVYILPPSLPYGDANWNLSIYDECSDKPDGIYRISAAANPGFSLDILGGSESEGINLQLYANSETDAQLFHLRRISKENILTANGQLEEKTIVSLMNINSQLFLDKDDGTTNVHQFGNLPDTKHRQWIMHNNGDGTYSFESVVSDGYFMTIVKGTTDTDPNVIIENGSNIAIAPPNEDGSPTLYQKFTLNAEYVHGDHRLGSMAGYLNTGEYRLWMSTNNGRYDTRVLDIPSANKDQGTQAQIWDSGDVYTHQQIFDIQKAGEGWYTIRNISSGLYLATASGAAGRNFDPVQQLNTNSDAAKWAFVPRVRTDGSLSYWIVNKATGLYLLHYGDVNGSLVCVISVDNSAVVESDWRSWGMEAFLSQAPIGNITNGATGIAADQFDTSDTISLPIKIFDYNDDGLLFEYSLDAILDGTDNGGFSLVAGSATWKDPNTNEQNYSWTIGRNTMGENIFGDQINPNLNNYYIGSGQFWNSSPDGLNNMYMVNGNAIDLQFLSQLLNYSFYGEMISGNCTMGLVKPTIREVDGNRLLEYNDEVVAYVADLLDWTLRYREQYENGTSLDSIAQDVPLGTKIEAYDNDMAGLLLAQLKAANGNELLHYEDKDMSKRRQDIYATLEETYTKRDDLIGTWDDCKRFITTYTDAAYFILNNLFYPESYNMPQDKFDYLVLSKATLSNGKTAYVFDSNFSDSYNYVAGVTQSAVKYDFTAKTISNTSMLGWPFERAIYETAGGAHYTFLPVWASEGVQHGFKNPYSDDYSDKNYSYVLQCNGKFTYIENDGLFFDFEGDDDVYLFINGQLVLDIGGAHGATAVSMNLNDYVYAARAKVAAGTATDRDRALALVDGEDYSFDFYYMERHTAGANMRIATNIRVSDPNLDTDKKVYQNGQELNNGGLVNVDKNIEYSFEVGNPKDSIANLYRLSFTDAKLGVTIDADNGLTVNNNKTVNSVGDPLTVADLKIYFTNQQGTTQEIIMGGSNAEEKKSSLKAYLKEVNGHGLLPGCSIEIRGIYFNIENSDFTNGRFTNTLYVTANQNVDNSGDTYQDSVIMVICSASGPQYYQWSGQSLTVTKDKFTSDVKALLTKNSPLLEQIAPATSLGTVKKLEICDMMGNLINSNVATASDDGLSIHYGKPGTYVFYVKVTQEDNSTIVIPVQVYVVEVKDSVFVLDYGLKVKFGDLVTANDTLSVAGKTTSYTIEAMTGTAPTYENNHIVFSDGAQSVDGTYGKYLFTDDGIEYHPDQFMEGADSIYVAVRVAEGTPSKTIGEVNINTEVEMYKKITILPANVVYYEDDFPAISYSKAFSNDGVGSGNIYQSADQSGQYGYDDAYESGTTHSGSSAHAIQILDKENVLEFTFDGTGFELIGRCNDTDNCVIIVEVRDSNDDLVKRIPVILEYDNKAVTNDEGIYQVPVVRVDDLAHGQYTVQIRGVPVYLKDDQDEYVKDDQGNYVINTTNPPILYVDGLRIYNPLSIGASDRDHYTDGEDTADFLEIRDLILEGKVAVIGFSDNDYSITTGTSIFTENRNETLYPINTFTINSVSHGSFFAGVLSGTENKEPLLGLRTEKDQFKFTFAKAVDGVDYYYIHINCDGTERYLKKISDVSNVMLISTDSLDEDGFLWQFNYPDNKVSSGIVTIRNKDGSYLSVSSVNNAAKTGEILALTVDTITDAQKWELGSVPSSVEFKGNAVSSVNDYLVFGPNNELYLDGENASQALVFYFTPDEKPETTSMIQVGVHVLNDIRLFGKDSDNPITPGILYQGANTGTPGFKVIDDEIISSTERYYCVDLSICKYDEVNNRYEVVLHCEGGYLSFTNLKVSGGTISSVNGKIADLRYNNGVLEMLTTVGTSETMTWTAVSNPEEYVDFESISRQMMATVMYEPDVDTGEFVPALPDIEDKNEVKLVGRSLLFKDIIKMRFYFDISATGITNATPDNSGLLVWTEEEYAALDHYTIDTAGERVYGLINSANGCYADTKGIPAKNMVDQLYVRAYVILPDGSYAYSEVTEFSPVMYAQIILEKEDASDNMKELVIALMNYGAAAQVYFNYETGNLMNAWLMDEQRNYAWSDDLINVLPEDVSKYTFTANDQIEWRGSSVTFVGAVNHNFYFQIPEELMQGALKTELLYWTESDYNSLSELTVDNASKVTFSVTDGRAVIEGTAAKSLGNAFYFAVHVVYEDGEAFSQIYVDSAHDYARRVLSSNASSDEMKELAKALVYYSCKAKKQLGG